MNRSSGRKGCITRKNKLLLIVCIEPMKYNIQNINSISSLTANLYFKNFDFKISNKKHSQYYQIGLLSENDMQKR